MNKNNKFFFVVGSFKLGGTERTASRIGLELLNRGYEVKFLLINGIFDYDDPRLEANSVILTQPGSSRVQKLFSVFYSLKKIVQQEKPDYLVSFSLGINLVVFPLFHRHTIFRIESNIFHYKTRLYRRYLQNYFSMFPHIKKVVIPSSGLFDKSYEYFKSNNKLVQIDNPIDITEINRKKKSPINDFPQLESCRFIVSAGRLHSSKGFDQLIRTYKKTLYRHDYRLLLLGEGPERSNLERIIKDLCLEKSVILGGFQRNPYRFISRSQFFVLNSDHESFGNVLIEAFACGVPVVSNDCDFGPRHIISHNQNGLLYDRQNQEEFEKSLLQLEEDKDLYERLKNGAENAKKKYEISNIMDEWLTKTLV